MQFWKSNRGRSDNCPKIFEREVKTNNIFFFFKMLSKRRQQFQHLCQTSFDESQNRVAPYLKIFLQLCLFQKNPQNVQLET